MTIKVDKQMREKIDAKKIDMKKKNYIYESPDHGKTIFRREIYDDVSGVKVDNSQQLQFSFDKTYSRHAYNEGFNDAREADKKAISLLSQRVLELEEVIDKIMALVK